MRILLTNDDGIDAIGLTTLRPVLEEFGEVTVVAPASGMSGCSHCASEGSFRVFRLDPRRFAVEGTPADCVRVGLHLFPDGFDWVFSGINDGGNLGVDVYHSGTVAAVREAVLRGVRGFALSHYRCRVLTEKDWVRAGEWARGVIRELLANQGNPNQFSRGGAEGAETRTFEPNNGMTLDRNGGPELGYWNVNFPCPPEGDLALPEMVFCPLESAPLPVEYLVDGNAFRYHGRYAMRGRSEGSDVAVCFGGKIAVSYVVPMERSF